MRLCGFLESLIGAKRNNFFAIAFCSKCSHTYFLVMYFLLRLNSVKALNFFTGFFFESRQSPFYLYSLSNVCLSSRSPTTG